MKSVTKLVLTAFSLLILGAISAAGDVFLVRDGRPDAEIRAFTDSAACREAATELQRYLAKMSGATLAIQFSRRSQGHYGEVGSAASAQSGTVVRLGLARDLRGDLAGRSGKRRLKPEGFWILVEEKAGLPPKVCIVGKDYEGLWFGVYEFLESLGCRWFFPGELGEDVPRKPTIALRPRNDVQSAAFVHRNFWWAYGRGRPKWHRNLYTVWRRRNKMGGVAAHMRHNLHEIIRPSAYGKAHPDFFPLRGGQRYIPKSDREHGWQPCTSNPEVIEIAARKAIEFFDRNPRAYAYSLSPADGYGWCECDRCTAQDPPKFRGMGKRGKGRRMTIFANAVAERLARRHPDKYVCWYAYAGTVEAPDDVPVHPNVVIALAHYGWCGCNIHAIQDSKCGLNAKFHKVIGGWVRKRAKLFIREYWTVVLNRVDVLSRVCAAYSLADDIPYYKAKGAVGFSSESVPDYGSCALNFWIAGRLMWKADADKNALFSEFYDGMYGPAAAVMRQYFETIRDISRSRSCRHSFLKDDELKKLGAMLDHAAALCRTEKQRGRVQMSRDLFDYVKAVRHYSLRSSAATMKSITAMVDRLEKRRSLAVDFVCHRAVFGRKVTTVTKAAQKYCGANVKPLTAEPTPAAATKAGFVLRKRHTYVVLLRRDEELRGRVEVRRLGRYLSPAAVTVLGPGKKSLLYVKATVGEPAEIRMKARQSGLHVLAVNAGRNAARVFVENQYFCLAGGRWNFLKAQPYGYFVVHPGAQEASVTLYSDATGDPKSLGETAMMTAYDATGKKIASGDTVSGRGFTVKAPVPATQRGKAWSVRLGRAPRGHFEDLRLVLGQGCGDFLATHPTRLIVFAQKRAE